jgi:hypothetical protein
MEEKILKDTTIRQYLLMLRNGSMPAFASQINELLNSKIQNFSGGFDLALFQMQKDFLLMKCKALMAMLEFDKEKQAKYEERAEQLRKEIEKKTKQKKTGNVDPYKSFLDWLLVLKKYYGSEIDRDNDLVYLVSATEQMMNYYKAQEKQIEESKSKKK